VVKFIFLKKLDFLESKFEKPSNTLMKTPTEGLLTKHKILNRNTMKHITTTIALGLFALATPVFADDAKSANNSAVATAKKDIVDTAVAAGSFKTLAAALQAAGLVDALKGDGPFTVFAPTDEAFAKLDEGTVENLLKKENKDKLVEILTYHVVSGKVMAKTAVTLDKATALNKKDIALAVKGKSLTLNSTAKVIKADIDCTNGVIHVIDTVILPPAK